MGRRLVEAPPRWPPCRPRGMGSCRYAAPAQPQPTTKAFQPNRPRRSRLGRDWLLLLLLRFRCSRPSSHPSIHSLTSICKPKGLRWCCVGARVLAQGVQGITRLPAAAAADAAAAASRRDGAVTGTRWSRVGTNGGMEGWMDGRWKWEMGDDSQQMSSCQRRSDERCRVASFRPRYPADKIPAATAPGATSSQRASQSSSAVPTSQARQMPTRRSSVWPCRRRCGCVPPSTRDGNLRLPLAHLLEPKPNSTSGHER